MLLPPVFPIRSAKALGYFCFILFSGADLGEERPLSPTPGPHLQHLLRSSGKCCFLEPRPAAGNSSSTLSSSLGRGYFLRVLISPAAPGLMLCLSLALVYYQCSQRPVWLGIPSPPPPCRTPSQGAAGLCREVSLPSHRSFSWDLCLWHSGVTWRALWWGTFRAGRLTRAVRPAGPGPCLSLSPQCPLGLSRSQTVSHTVPHHHHRQILFPPNT